jgi:hypothetical protein
MQKISFNLQTFCASSNWLLTSISTCLAQKRNVKPNFSSSTWRICNSATWNLWVRRLGRNITEHIRKGWNGTHFKEVQLLASGQKQGTA